jgi:hypothetical protein
MIALVQADGWTGIICFDSGATTYPMPESFPTLE